MTINIDTYVSEQEAIEYIGKNYPKLDNLACYFMALTSDDKRAYLMQSAGQIDSLLILGKKYDKNQTMEFPRRCCYKEGPEVPLEVKNAQIENALGLLHERLSKRSDEQIMIMSSLGAFKNIKYNKREMGNVGLSESVTDITVKQEKRLASEDAEKLLRPWIGG